MKAWVAAIAVAALSTATLAGATREAVEVTAVKPPPTAVMADASRVKPAALGSLNGSTPWSKPPAAHEPFDVEAFTERVDPGTLIIVAGIAVLGLARPLTRSLRRHEQQRRADALASALGRPPRH